MPTAPELSPQTTQHLENARVLARATADALESEAGGVKQLQNFDHDILYVREFPEHFMRGVERGGRRLDYAARAVRRIADDVDKVLLGKVPTAFGHEPDLEVPATKHHGKRTKVDPTRARQHISPIRGHVEFSGDMRGNLRRIETELAAASTQKGVSAMIETIGTARGSLQNFEFYIGELVSRVRKMVQALEDWDGKGKRPHLPPAKNRKPNRPRPTGPGGKGTSAADAPAKTTWPSKNPSQQQVACYLAANAKKYGIPPTLPVVCALVESNLKNISYGDRDSVGLFQIRANMHPAPAGFGSASGKIQNASWWQAHPDAQMKWFANEAKRVSHGSGTDAATIGTWAANTERPAAEYRGRYQQRFSEAKAMVDKCAKMATPTATTNTPGGHNSGGSAGTKPPGGGTTPKPKSPGGQNSSGKTEAEKGLDKALAELKKNVRELNGNSNSGKEVNKYLGSTKTAIGSPWCAAFVHWCLSQAGFKFPGGGWASCETYQTEARKPNGSMFVVGHREARPGDLIVWGGEHIGIVESVKGGTIHYVAGNEGNAVARGTSSISASDYTIIRPRNQ